MSTPPRGWLQVRLGDLGHLVRGVTYSRGDASNQARGEDIAILRAGNIQSGHITRADLVFIPGHLVGNEQLLQQNDVVIAMSSGSASVVGKAALVTHSDNRTSFGAFCSTFRPHSPAIAPWLGHFFQTSQYRQHVADSCAGVNINNLRSQHILEAPSSVPPLAEQRRIISKLESLLARSRRAREALDAIPALLEKFHHSVLAAAFRGDLTADWRAQHPDVEPVSHAIARLSATEKSQRRSSAEATPVQGRFAICVGEPEKPAPNSWTWVQLTNIARLETGHTPSRSHPEYWGGEFPWIGIKDARANHGGVIENTEQTITQAGLDNSAARLLPAGTVCLSRTASVGYVFVLGRTMATSQDFVCWVCSDAIAPKFLVYLLMAEGDDIRRFGKGSTHTTIYFPEVMAFHVCLPSRSEQEQIVREIELRFAAIERLRDAWRHGHERIQELDGAILAKAFRGELVPQDPNDEPASVLLERLRAERATSAEAAPKRSRAARASASRPGPPAESSGK